jgi:hypothetical protein
MCVSRVYLCAGEFCKRASLIASASGIQSQRLNTCDGSTILETARGKGLDVIILSIEKDATSL